MRNVGRKKQEFKRGAANPQVNGIIGETNYNTPKGRDYSKYEFKNPLYGRPHFERQEEYFNKLNTRAANHARQINNPFNFNKAYGNYNDISSREQQEAMKPDKGVKPRLWDKLDEVPTVNTPHKFVPMPTIARIMTKEDQDIYEELNEMAENERQTKNFLEEEKQFKSDRAKKLEYLLKDKLLKIRPATLEEDFMHQIYKNLKTEPKTKPMFKSDVPINFNVFDDDKPAPLDYFDSIPSVDVFANIKPDDPGNFWDQNYQPDYILDSDLIRENFGHQFVGRRGASAASALIDVDDDVPIRMERIYDDEGKIDEDVMRANYEMQRLRRDHLFGDILQDDEDVLAELRAAEDIELNANRNEMFKRGREMMFMGNEDRRRHEKESSKSKTIAHLKETIAQPKIDYEELPDVILAAPEKKSYAEILKEAPKRGRGRPKKPETEQEKLFEKARKALRAETQAMRKAKEAERKEKEDFYHQLNFLGQISKK